MRASYWLRLLRLFALALLAALVLTPLLFGAGQIALLMHPPCGGGSEPAALGLTAEDLRLHTTQGLAVNGYFIPGTSDAAVVLIPAYNQSRAAQLNIAQLLHSAGYHVLTLDSRVCGALGWLSLGAYEVEDVLAGLDYLLQRADVNPQRIGLYGFSSAGATALMTASRSAVPRAVIALGGYHNYPRAIGMDEPFHPFFSLFNLGTGAMYRLQTGSSIRQLDAIGSLAHWNGQALLLIYGSVEVSLPGAREMLAQGQALGLDVALWVVPNADHGDYWTIAPQAFAERVLAFYRRHLLLT